MVMIVFFMIRDTVTLTVMITATDGDRYGYNHVYGHIPVNIHAASTRRDNVLILRVTGTN